MRRRVPALLVLPLLVWTACGSGNGNHSQADAALPNTAPSFVAGWTERPTIRQGTELLLTDFTLTDAEGDACMVTVSRDQAGLDGQMIEDSSALEIRAGYQVSGVASVTLTIRDVRGASTLEQVEVEVLPIKWQASETWGAAGPEAREHGSLIYDEAGGRVLLYAGSGYSPYLDPLGDLWEYDLANGTWAEITPTGNGSSMGGSQRVAQIPGQSVAYLFGGYGVNGAAFGELYRLDYSGGGVELTLMNQVNPPGARALHAFVYDPVLDRFLLFGGINGSNGIMNDTWVMTVSGDTATWEPQSPLETPTRRYGFFYGFDPLEGRLIVYSGAQGTASVNPATDTWILDARAEPVVWTLVAEGEAEGVPPGRRNGCMVFDDDLSRLYVFGGTPDAQTTAPGLYVFDARPGLERWSLLNRADEPDLRSSGFGFYDPATEQVVMGFGNSASAVYADFNFLGY